MSLVLFQFTHPGGVRRRIVVILEVVCVFQFTHPGGVRLTSPWRVCATSLSFNSRTREGCDFFFTTLIPVSSKVSIHAPGRGATATRRARRHCASSFNSRTREGCDTDLFIPDALDYEFQFTHPGGVRPAGVLIRLSEASSFNSRTREGCDAVHVLCLDEFRDVSIHAPGRGATWACRRQARSLLVSIHAPGRGATTTTNASPRSLRCFNSRTREGCDSMVQSCVLWGG